VVGGPGGLRIGGPSQAVGGHETHLYVYAHRPDVFGICHTHSPYCGIFAALGSAHPACLTTQPCWAGRSRWAATCPSEARRSARRSYGPSATLAPSSCRITCLHHGNSPQQATKFAVEVEEIAMIVHNALLRGQPIILTPEQLAETATCIVTSTDSPPCDESHGSARCKPDNRVAARLQR